MSVKLVKWGKRIGSLLIFRLVVKLGSSQTRSCPFSSTWLVLEFELDSSSFFIFLKFEKNKFIVFWNPRRKWSTFELSNSALVYCMCFTHLRQSPWEDFNSMLSVYLSRFFHSFQNLFRLLSFFELVSCQQMKSEKKHYCSSAETIKSRWAFKNNCWSSCVLNSCWGVHSHQKSATHQRLVANCTNK